VAGSPFLALKPTGCGSDQSLAFSPGNTVNAVAEPAWTSSPNFYESDFVVIAHNQIDLPSPEPEVALAELQSGGLEVLQCQLLRGSTDVSG